MPSTPLLVASPDDDDDWDGDVTLAHTKMGTFILFAHDRIDYEASAGGEGGGELYPRSCCFVQALAFSAVFGAPIEVEAGCACEQREMGMMTCRVYTFTCVHCPNSGLLLRTTS